MSTNEVGVRELRADLARHLRRAGGGDRIVVTVDGRPVASIGPIEAGGPLALSHLVHAGLVDPPGRPDRPSAPDPAVLPVDVRVDGVVAEVRA